MRHGKWHVALCAGDGSAALVVPCTSVHRMCALLCKERQGLLCHCWLAVLPCPTGHHVQVLTNSSRLRACCWTLRHGMWHCVPVMVLPRLLFRAHQCTGSVRCCARRDKGCCAIAGAQCCHATGHHVQVLPESFQLRALCGTSAWHAAPCAADGPAAPRLTLAHQRTGSVRCCARRDSAAGPLLARCAVLLCLKAKAAAGFAASIEGMALDFDQASGLSNKK